jgi:hypothetical protein
MQGEKNRVLMLFLFRFFESHARLNFFLLSSTKMKLSSLFFSTGCFSVEYALAIVPTQPRKKEKNADEMPTTDVGDS